MADQDVKAYVESLNDKLTEVETHIDLLLHNHWTMDKAEIANLKSKIRALFGNVAEDVEYVEEERPDLSQEGKDLRSRYKILARRFWDVRRVLDVVERFNVISNVCLHND